MKRDYSHRDVLDKLGLRSDAVARLVEDAWVLDAEVRKRLETRVRWSDQRPVDYVFATVSPETDIDALLEVLAPAIVGNGAVWLLARKRQDPLHVRLDSLPGRGPASGLVDNKVCSVSPAVSGIRFVLRRERR